MAPPAYQLLKATRLTAIINELQDARQLPQELRFLSRTPVVPAVDSEIMARWTGYVLIADLVADDQQALTYSSGKLSFESTNIPNLKHGRQMTQEQLNQMLAIAANRGIESDQAMFLDWQTRLVDELLLGVRQRMEALIVAMAIDALNYDRFGIKIANGTWGMPSDLKVTPAVSWDNAATATPVDDIWTVRRTASVRYGKTFNRVTMSTQAFMYMIATTEFQTKARAYIAPNVSYAALPLANLEQQRAIAGGVLGMEIELYDARYWTQAGNGAITSAPFLPINKVVLSNSADDGVASVQDFASGITTESVVDSLVDGQMIGGLGGPTRGPIAYAAANPTLNPPTITMWGVARGFPRKHQRQATAVLTVGSFSDTIPVGPPF